MKRLLHDGNDDKPQFDLPIENEILRLKLKAEFGAECTVASQHVPDIVVNEFLRSVYEFEQKFRQPGAAVRIYEKVGQPYFRKAEVLDDSHLSFELRRLTRCLEQHNLQLDIMGDYSDRIIYKFLTEEFFYVEMDNIDMPGFIHHFCYEDFHPNHELDIRHRVLEFLSQWFSKQINEYSWQLYDAFVLPDSREYSKDVVLRKVECIFKAYTEFRNCEYMINHLEFDWDNLKSNGKGFVSGKVRYDARIESGEIVHVEGEYEFYLLNTGSWWSIYYFVFPGFDWS